LIWIEWNWVLNCFFRHFVNNLPMISHRQVVLEEYVLCVSTFRLWQHWADNIVSFSSSHCVQTLATHTWRKHSCFKTGLNKLQLATLRFRFRHSVEKNFKDTDSGSLFPLYVHVPVFIYTTIKFEEKSWQNRIGFKLFL
jgi:hypothetical protein